MRRIFLCGQIASIWIKMAILDLCRFLELLNVLREYIENFYMMNI